MKITKLLLAIVAAFGLVLGTFGLAQSPASANFSAAAASATITFNSNDGSAATVDNTYDVGATDALTFDNPWTRDGYTFVGWSADPSATAADTTFEVTGDGNLFAIWAVTPFTITYIANDGSPNYRDIKLIPGYEDALAQPKIWSRTGYSFLGWSIDSNATVPDTFFVVSADATLYGVWQQNEAGTFTITFSKNDSSGASQDQVFSKGDTTVLTTDNPFTRDGYTFLGWSTNKAATIPLTTYKVSADATIYAIWAVNSYSVTYDANDASGRTGFQVLNYGDANALAFANPFARTNYTFLGWSADAAATQADTSFTVTADVTLYAVWFLPNYTITYDANDGTDNTQTEQFDKGYADALKEPKIWTRDGYAFLGWATKSSATAADKTYSVSADATLYAIWKLIPAGSANITFAANDGTASAVDVIYTVGATTALARTNTFTYVGHKFLGWSIDPAAEAADKTFKVASDTTLYAIWGLNSYVITYSANDGSNHKATQSLLFGDTTAFEFENTFARTGYSFAGWAADPAATEPEYSYSVSDAATVYALWTINSYTITYDANDGSLFTDSATLNFGDNTALGFAGPAERDGFSFLGWSTDANATAPLKTFTVSDDVTLYAVWHQIINVYYNVTYHSNDGNDQTEIMDYMDGDNFALDYSSSWARDGFAFLGWSVDSHATVADSYYVVISDVDLYAVWQQITHNVTYDANDRSGKTTTVVVNDGVTTALAYASTWTRLGFTLLGWSTDPTAKVADTDLQVYDDVALFAIWHRIVATTHKVTYHSADGKDLTMTANYADGATTALAKTTTWTRDGYSFLGWSVDYAATAADGRLAVIDDADLFAVWAEAPAAILGPFPNRAKGINTKTYKLVAPTSNSKGAVSYSLDCPDVATLKGTTVTLVGVGTCEITVLVAAKPNYGEATATMTLTITPELKAIKVSPPKNGDAISTDDGEDIINLVRTNDAVTGKVSYLSDDPYEPDNRWSLDIQSISGTAKAVPLDAKNFLNFETVGKVKITGTGYLPGSSVNLYIGSTLLGTATTDADGAFTGTFAVAKTIKLGSNYVQVNGITKNDTIRSISQLVLIKLPTYTVTKSITFVGTASKITPAAAKILTALKATLKGKKNIVITIGSWVKTAANIKADVKTAAARSAAIITALKKTYKIVGTFTYLGYTLSPANKAKITRLDLVITYN